MCETLFYVKEKVQIKDIYKVGAEESMAVYGKKCKKCDESYTMKNHIIWSPHKYFCYDKIKKDDMGRACCMHGRHDN